MRRMDEMPPCFAMERDGDGIATLIFDSPADPVNALSEPVALELERLLDTIAADPKIRALVIASGKPDTFAAGAKLEMLESVSCAEEGERIARMAQHSFDRLSRLMIPTVAAIHGACVGGGLEWVLACTCRIATDSPKTVLGSPEIRLGIIPGAGGTQRLPRLIGLAPALEMILTGKNVRAKRALKMGLVDEVVPSPLLLPLAKKRALALMGGKPVERAPRGLGRLRNQPPSRFVQQLLDGAVWTEAALEQNPVGRAAIFAKARKQVASQSRHYPAPLKAIEAIECGLERGMEAGLDLEARHFGALCVTPVARQLMNLFFAQTALKKDPGIEREGVLPRPVRKVGVLGAGLMGTGVAYVTAEGGIPCRLKDKDDASLGKGLRAVRNLFDARVTRRSMTPLEREGAMMRVTGATDLSGFTSADVVIEAVFEDLPVKQKVLREIEAISRPDQIFASNTSSIPITRIAEASARPWNVLGMHYFSPVQKMPLLEVIATRKTSPEAIATAVALGKQQGKTVIVVNDGPGFYTSRILAPYVNEAAHLVTEGVDPMAIDRALCAFGFPVGPIVLMDEVGLDVGAKVAHILSAAFGERMAAPLLVDRCVQEGRLGRKSGKGFYRYARTGERLDAIDPAIFEKLDPRLARKVMSDDAIVDRVLLPMLNEAFRCLGEGVLRSPRDGDIGAVFGLGFPPFRGGPFRYVDEVGPQTIRSRLEELTDKLGSRFAPAPLLVELARSGKRTY